MSEVRPIPLSQIRPDPKQPRKVFHERELGELARSLEALVWAGAADEARGLELPYEMSVVMGVKGVGKRGTAEPVRPVHRNVERLEYMLSVCEAMTVRSCFDCCARLQCGEWWDRRVCSADHSGAAVDIPDVKLQELIAEFMAFSRLGQQEGVVV